MPGFAFPTEIIVGAEGYAAPVDMARAMQGAIPGAEMTVLAALRHFTPLEVPDRIAAILARLLDRC